MIPVPEYRAYFDRKIGSTMGRFSIRHKEGEYLLENILARSGQDGFLKSSWLAVKSPIPYGSYNLYTLSENIACRAGERGIGEYFPIDNQGDRLTVCDPKNKKRKRKGLCLHEDDGQPGTEGRIMIIYHVDWLRVMNWLKNQSIDRVSIPLEVL
jgi:hypothetical protein